MIKLTPEARDALQLYLVALTDARGDHVVEVVRFHSETGQDDGVIDLAIVLSGSMAVGQVNAFLQELVLQDLADDAISRLGVRVRPWALSESEWDKPHLHLNPSLVRSIRRHGIKIPKP